MSLVSKVLLTTENPAVASFVACGSVLVVKSLLMVPLTARQRLKHGVPISPEDTKLFEGKAVLKSHEDVDRVRRAHLNDLENIPIFFFAGCAYLLTNPNPATAITLFRIYTLARCAHTFVYAVYVVPQPARAIAFTIGYAITGYMAIKAFLHFNCLPCPSTFGNFKPF